MFLCMSWFFFVLLCEVAIPQSCSKTAQSNTKNKKAECFIIIMLQEMKYVVDFFNFVIPL